MTESLRNVVDDALARAVVYRSLSLGFQLPTSERLRLVGVHDGFEVLTAALQRLHAGGRHVPVAQAAERLTGRSVPTDEALAATYWLLFGHTARGPICACETEYGPDSGFQQPHELADICGYYEAFGLQPAVGLDARADHVACECEFMDFLNRKEALWAGRGPDWPDRDDVLDLTRRAARTFLRDHLARFGYAFGARVVSADPHGYFGALGHVLLALIEAECARMEVATGPIDLALRPDEADHAPMACGTPDQLIQIQRR